MQFFLCEIVARVVAICLFVNCSRDLWHGLVERKIVFLSPDFLEWLLLGGVDWVAHRDAAPIRYWMQIGGEIMTLAACLVVAIFGWWVPNT
jgi:hypothetical protein